MGQVAVDAVRAASDLEYVGGFARVADTAQEIDDDFNRLLRERKPDVVVDFTTHPKTIEIAREALEAGVSPVIGSSAWTAEQREELARLAQENDVGALLVPNFALGAVLMMRWAQEAAQYFPSIEIVEKHSAKKLDKPSGTARMTADQLHAITGKTVPIHSVRMHGLVAHQEVLFGNTGELLTIRHDSLTRESFAPGIVFAAQSVRYQQGLTIGLDAILSVKRS